MTLTLALALSAVLSTVYAVFLARSDFGLWMRQEMTWLTVVVGVGLTLGGIALVDAAAAGLAVWFFAATGLPIVAESLVRMWRQHRAAQRLQTERRDGE